MAGFLYYREGAQSLAPGEPAKLQLQYAIGRSVTSGGVSNKFPSGKAGVIFADPDRHAGKTVGYYPDQQTWRKLPNVEGRPECWVGYWNDAKPGPGDLARSKQLRGMPVELADGQTWEVPIVRSFDGARQEWTNQLPAAWAADEHGNLVPGGEPKAIYRHLWDLTAPLADKILAIASGEDVEWPDDAHVGKVVTALLQVNYSVSAAEIGMLEIVGGDDVFAIIAVASRYDTLKDWIDQKKTSDLSAGSGVTSSSGEAA